MTSMKKLTAQFMPEGKVKTGEHHFCMKCHRDGQRCKCKKEAEDLKYDQLTDWERYDKIKKGEEDDKKQ